MAKTLLLVISVCYTGAIAYLSLIDLADTPVKSFGISDKVMHTTAYFIMALLWLAFVKLNYKNGNFSARIIYTCLFIIVFGIVIEIIQGKLTDYRDLDFFDIIANSIGVISAGIIMWRFKRNFNQVKS